MRIRCLLAGALFSSLFLALLVSADDTGWLSQKLEYHEKQARWWQYSWTAFHSATAVIESHEANRSHNKSIERAKTVSAVASGLGIADLLFDPLYTISDFGGSDAASRLKGLAERIEERTSWRGHLAGWLTGLVGGLVIAGGHGKESDGWEFFALSGLVSEAQIWTLPKGAVQDWKDCLHSGQVAAHAFRDNCVASFKPAAARAIPHGLEVLWWF